MNAVEIEQAISNLAAKTFDPANFPYAFLEAFGNPTAAIKRLKSGSTNKSDIEGRRFKNDTERLEKLFELYTQMTISSKEPT